MSIQSKRFSHIMVGSMICMYKISISIGVFKHIFTPYSAFICDFYFFEFFLFYCLLKCIILYSFMLFFLVCIFNMSQFQFQFHFFFNKTSEKLECQMARRAT